ncbi:MAG TPA: glycosyltransferase family 87 protein [Candidatus Dormibacteraeota bacterium]|nr:glycosyltransferase family 87 protein [Candidatus Dormibacteraeota bacterium]
MRRVVGWPDPRQVTLSALIALLLVIYAWITLAPVFGAHTPRADDFEDYIFAAHKIATGGDPYAAYAHTHVAWDWSLSSGYLYPPVFAAFLLPLTLISNDLAVRLWLVLMQLAVIASLLIIYRTIGRPSRGELLGLVAVLTTFFPLISSALTGSMNALLLLLLTGAWAAWHARRDAASGVLTGIGAVFKLIPLGLLPYLVWRRHWKLLAAMVATGIVGIIAGLLVTGLDHNIYYYRDMVPHLSVGTGYRENQSIAGVTARLCAPSTATQGGGAGWCGRLLDWPLVLLLLGALLAATSRATRSRLEYALAVTALPLISSVTWGFHLVILVLPIALLLRQAFSGALSRAAGRVLIVAWLCFSIAPAIHYLLIFHPLPHWPGVLDLLPLGITRLFAEAYFVGTVLIFGSLWFIVRHERRATVAADAQAVAA